MMLADDHFNVNAEIPRTSQYLDDASARFLRARREARDLHVDVGAVDIAERRNVAGALAFDVVGGRFLPALDDNLLAQAAVFRDHKVVICAALEASDHFGMSPAQDFADPPFGPSTLIDASQANLHGIAM